MTEEQEKIYNEIHDGAEFPKHLAFGTAKTLLNYHANGEASDWILHETGIIALSPELGDNSAYSYTFDIPSVRIEADILM